MFTIAFKPKKQEYLTHNITEKTHGAENDTPSFTSKLIIRKNLYSFIIIIIIIIILRLVIIIIIIIIIIYHVIDTKVDTRVNCMTEKEFFVVVFV